MDIFPAESVKPRKYIIQWLNMNTLHRLAVFTGILFLLLILALAPPILAGYRDLAQANAQRSSVPARAALEYESAARRLPWRSDLWEQAGLMSLADDNPSRAVELLKKTVPLSATGQLALGDALFRSGDVKGAVSQWEKMNADGLGSAPLFNRLGHVYYELGKYDEAIENFDIAQKLDYLNADSHYMLGLLLATRSPELALVHLIRAAQLDQKLDPVVQSLRHGLSLALLSSNPAEQLTGAGRSLAASGAWTLGREAFSNAIKADPENALAWAWLGEAKQILNQGGLVELDHALKLDPASAEIHGLRGVYWMRENQYDEARKEYQLAADIEKSNPGWQVSLGDAIARTGNVPNGLEHYQQAIDLSPKSAEYWRMLANFTVDYNYGVQEIGIPAALQARALLPDDPQNTVALGRAYFATGDSKTAEKLWLDVMESHPGLANVHLYLGVLYLQQGNLDSAKSHLSQAKQLDPTGPFGYQAGHMLDQYFP
jgi:tetratricopeptide (TPR) repeat protein